MKIQRWDICTFASRTACYTQAISMIIESELESSTMCFGSGRLTFHCKIPNSLWSPKFAIWHHYRSEIYHSPLPHSACAKCVTQLRGCIYPICHLTYKFDEGVSSSLLPNWCCMEGHPDFRR
jgi:hypothetical protein